MRPGERKKTVYHCQVLGSKGSGRTTIVRGLIGKEQVGVVSEWVWLVVSGCGLCEMDMFNNCGLLLCV